VTHRDPVYDPPERVALDDALAKLFALLGRPHTAAIVRRFACDPGPWRYTELQATLGVSPTTLSRRLSALADAGLVEREAYDESPPRVEYTATAAAEALRPAFDELLAWAAEHGDVDAAEPDDGGGPEGTEGTEGTEAEGTEGREGTEAEERS
jgi:DNA-binding HxlR family transcriptional regulator